MLAGRVIVCGKEIAMMAMILDSLVHPWSENLLHGDAHSLGSIEHRRSTASRRALYQNMVRRLQRVDGKLILARLARDGPPPHAAKLWLPKEQNTTALRVPR